MTREEYVKICTVLHMGNEYHKQRQDITLMFVLIADGGFQIGELLSIRAKDCFRIGDYGFVYYEEYRTGKRKCKTIKGYNESDVRKYIRENGIQDDELIFPLGLRAYQKIFKEIREELGIPEGSLRDARAYLVKGKDYSGKVFTEEELEQVRIYNNKYKEIRSKKVLPTKKSIEYGWKLQEYIKSRKPIK